jgi:hypothetical protein
MLNISFFDTIIQEIVATIRKECARMINQLIEGLRGQLYETANPNGLTSEQTLQVSNELNKLLNYHSRTSNTYQTFNYTTSKVHANAILNILEVSAKEKFDLPYLLENRAAKPKEWYQIDLVRHLLDSISMRYGSEAVEYMGEFVPEKCIFPESINHFQSSMLNLNYIYHANHNSNVYIGEYLPYKLTKNEIQMFCHTPHYPAAFNHGIIKGLAKKFNHSLRLTQTNTDHGGQYKIVL